MKNFYIFIISILVENTPDLNIILKAREYKDIKSTDNRDPKQIEVSNKFTINIETFENFIVNICYYDNFSNFKFENFINDINFMTVEYIPSENPKFLSFTYWKKKNYCCVIKVTQQNIINFERKVENKLIYSLSSSRLKGKTLKALNDLIASFTDSESTFKSIFNDKHAIKSSLSAYSLLVIGFKSFLPFFVGRLFDAKNLDPNIIRSHFTNPIKIESGQETDYIKLYSFGESNFLIAQYHNVSKDPFYCIIQSFDPEETNHLYDIYYTLKGSKYIPRLIGYQNDSYNRKLPVLEHNFTTNLISIFDESILTPTEKSRIIIQILFAIHNMHKQCYFHRDINSLHILIDRFKNAYLQITNQARAYAEPSETVKNEFKYFLDFDDDVGAQHYMSPEQYSSKTYTYLTDIYSFGIIAFFLIFNSPNFKRRIKETLNKYSTYILYNGFNESKFPDIVKKEIKINELLDICLKGGEKQIYRTTALFLLRIIRERKLFYIGTDEREMELLFAENDDFFQEIKEIEKFPDFQYFKKNVIKDSQTTKSNESFFYLGVLYQEGISFEKNIYKAIEYYKKSVQLGNKNAAYNLGIIYTTGQGEFYDPKNANYYFQMSSDFGSYEAMFNIANELRDRGKIELAIEKFKDAGEHGYIAKAYYNLGIIYFKKKNKYEALTCFKQAASMGFNDAYYNAGTLCYQLGFPDEAKNYLKIAGEKGYSDGYYNLSFIYNEGDPEYFDCLQKAASMMNWKAAHRLGVFLYDRNFNLSCCYITLSMILSNSDNSIKSFDRIVNSNHKFDYMKKVKYSLFESRKFNELDIFVYKGGRQMFIENCLNDISKSNLLNIFLRNMDFDTFVNNYIGYKQPSDEVIVKYSQIAQSEELIKRLTNKEKEECSQCGTYLYKNKNELLGIRLLRKAAKLHSISALKILTFISYQFGLNETFFLTLDDFKEQDDSYFDIFQQYFHKSILINTQKKEIKIPSQVDRKVYIHCLFISTLIQNEKLEFPTGFIDEKNQKEKKFLNYLIDIVNYSIGKCVMNDEIAMKNYYIGKCYIKGKYIKKNMKIGEALIIEAANFGLKEALRGLGEIYYCRNYYQNNKGDIDLIIKYFEDADKKEDAISRRRRAIIFLNGNIVSKDESRAVSLMKNQKDPFLLFLYGCYLASKEKYDEARVTFSNCNNKYLQDSMRKFGKLQNMMNSVLFDFAKFNIGYLSLKTADSNQANIYFEDSKEYVNASLSIMKLYDLNREYTKNSPQELLENIIINTKNQTILKNIVDLIEFVVSFDRSLFIDEAASDILLSDKIQFFFESQLKIFLSAKMTYLCGVANFFIGCIEYRQNQYSDKALTYFIKAAKYNEVSGYLNLARIYKNNILFEKQDNYLRFCELAKASTNEAKLELGLVHLIGRNGAMQNFDLAMSYFEGVHFNLDDSRQKVYKSAKVINTREELNVDFYKGFNDD